MRIDKFISSNSAFSRSDIRSAAKKGKITLNGEIVKSVDIKIDPENDIVNFNGIEIKNIGNVYLVLNKPKGVISASNDKSQRTVLDLLPEKYKFLDIFPVGRLDKDTTGLLILTNDGDFAHKVISPKNDVPKTYLVEVDAEIKNHLISEFSKGVILADGTACRPANLEIIDKNIALITITEGKYHQVKRMFGVFNLGVNKLHRVSIGELELPKELEPGEIIEITELIIKKMVLKSPK